MCWDCDHPDGDYVEEVVLPTIRRAGWMLQYVEGEGQPSFCYTVGLTEAGLPEIVMTGITEQDAGMLNGVAQYTLGCEIRPGETMGLGEHVLEAVEVAHPEEHLLVAVSLYGPAVRGLQMVRADADGHWPWCSWHRRRRGGQPVLGVRSRDASCFR